MKNFSLGFSTSVTLINIFRISYDSISHTFGELVVLVRGGL